MCSMLVVTAFLEVGGGRLEYKYKILNFCYEVGGGRFE